MNFLTLASRLHRESMRSTAAPTAYSGASDRALRLFNAIADAWVEVQSERLWKWMRGTTDAALTVGLQTYTGTGLGVASRFGRWRDEDDGYWPIVYVSGTPNSQWPITQLDLDTFRKRWIYRTQGNSTPLEFATDDSQQLLIGPAPAVAYKVRADYWMEPSELAADANTPDMPSRFHMLLVWRALMDIARADAAPELLSKAEVNYAKMHDALRFDQAVDLPRL